MTTEAGQAHAEPDEPRGEAATATKLASQEISDLDPYKFMAVIGKRVIHPGGRASTKALLSRAQITASVADMQIAHRYQPASRAAEVGGDWFDVIPLDAGRVALVVGDVTGHGIHAAAIMGQLRTTTATLARLGCPPEEIMAQLTSVVAAHGGATCLHAVYDPASRRCRLTSAGHPRPHCASPAAQPNSSTCPAG